MNNLINVPNIKGELRIILKNDLRNNMDIEHQYLLQEQKKLMNDEHGLSYSIIRDFFKDYKEDLPERLLPIEESYCFNKKMLFKVKKEQLRTLDKMKNLLNNKEFNKDDFEDLIYKYQYANTVINSCFGISLTFKTSLISYLIQKPLTTKQNRDVEDKIIAFLIDLGKNNGVSFNEYIDDWAKRLIKENKDGWVV